MREVLRNILLVISIGLLLYAGISLYGIFREYEIAEKEYDKLQDLAVEKNKAEPQKEAEAPKASAEKKERADKEESDIQPPITVDFQTLQEINSQVIGWIHIGSLGISYPVVQGTDNAYYLDHSVEHQENSSGAIFLDYENSGDFSDPNSIIYGHNMKSGKMFGTLKQLLAKEPYEKDPYIWILTPTQTIQYQIFAAYTTEETSDTYTLFEERGEAFTEYLQTMRIRSEYDTGIQPADTIITLSTCSYSAKYRTVVQAVKK